MSNFSTFFPAAGGGGEGAGINSYAPFLVGATDNNPQGYVASTGVYTNPVDASVFLKTGKFLPPSLASTYPNATLTILPDTAKAPVEVPRTRSLAANATHIYTTGYVNTDVIKYDITTGSQVTRTPVPNSTQSKGIALTSNRVYVYTHVGSGNYTMESFDLNLVNIPGEQITGLPAYQEWATIVKLGTSWFASGPSPHKSIVEYNSNFTTVLNTYNVTIAGSTGSVVNTIAYDGTNFWLTDIALNTNTAYEYTPSFLPTGKTFVMTVIQSPANSLNFVGYNAGNSKYYALSQNPGTGFASYYQQYENVIGDLARTDTDSGQPLFIKLK